MGVKTILTISIDQELKRKAMKQCEENAQKISSVICLFLRKNFLETKNQEEKK